MSNNNNRKSAFYNLGKTILIGNGLSRAFNNSISWDDLIGKNNNDNNFESCPNTLLILLSNKSIDVILSLLSEYSTPSNEYEKYIKKLVDAGYYNFLTTNYTYEIEYSLLPINKRNHNSILRYSYSMNKDALDNSVSISNYIRIPYDGKIINICQKDRMQIGRCCPMFLVLTFKFIKISFRTIELINTLLMNHQDITTQQASV